MIQITLFPKKCHIHKLAMTWDTPKRAAWVPEAAGWRCPKCVLKCKTHDEPMRSGHTGSTKTLYCRRCRIKMIKQRAPQAYEITKSGVAIVYRVPA
jgi:hypothetical protein